MEMETLEWGPEATVGHPEVDEQHRRLFELFNIVLEAWRSELGADAVGAALGDLARYVKDHFAAEEALMHRLGYSGLERHRQEHRRYVEEIDALHARISDADPTAAGDILATVRRLLTEHLAEEDGELRAFLGDQPAAVAASG